MRNTRARNWKIASAGALAITLLGGWLTLDQSRERFCVKYPEWATPFSTVLGCDRFIARSPNDPALKPSNRADADHRTRLFKNAGIAWTSDNFWKAIEDGDAETVSQFLMGGMPINGERLHRVLSNDAFSKRAPLHRLVELGRDRNQEFCSSEDIDGSSDKALPTHRTVERFVAYAKDERIAQFVRDFCAGPAIVEALNRRLATESIRVTNAEQTNARNQKSQSSCRARFLTDQAVVRYQDMRRGVTAHGCRREDITDELERGLCLHRFPIVQQTNAYGNVLASAVDYEAGVREFCSKAFPVNAFDRTKRDELGIAIAAFAK